MKIVAAFLIYALLVIGGGALHVYGQTTHNTLSECQAAKGAQHIVLRSDGRCDAFTAQDIGKLPDHAKPGPAVAPRPTIEERVKALEEKTKALP